MEHQYSIQSLAEIQKVASIFLEDHASSRVFAFNGKMGAGKTTFILALLHEMGIQDPEGSPTYSLVNTYESDEYGSIFHFDMYRLKNEDEALDSGMEEMIDSGSYCFIEWPEKVSGLLPSDNVMVHILVNADGSRTIKTRL